MKRILFLIGVGLASCGAFAEIKVSDVKAFSGYPWKEVVVGYTITGKEDESYFVQLTLKATDKSANKTYTAQSLTGAVLTEGRHLLRWNAARDGVKFSSANVVFSVAVVRRGVQLWAKGPYWAECNVGATEPEEFGYYFWWGDTIGYKRYAANYDWVSVKNGKAFSFSQNNCPTYESVSQLQTDGYIDATGNLVAKYDAATAHLGAPWRMPTDAEIAALISNCDTTWTTRNGVYGRLVTGRGAYASKSIFLPAAGQSESLSSAGSVGCYWSSTPDPNNNIRWYPAWIIHFDSGCFYRDSNTRYEGLSVRAVRGSAK